MKAKAMAKKKAAIQGLPSGKFENASSQGGFPIEKRSKQKPVFFREMCVEPT